MKSKRNFTREFKLSILNELESKSPAEICREHNIGSNILSRWKKEFQRDPGKAFSGNGHIWKEDAKIAQYERLLGQAHAEIAFLKKTLETLQRRRIEEKVRSLQ